MKKCFIALAALFVLSINTAFAANVNNYSQDVKIRSALNLLNEKGASEVFENLDFQKAQVMFHDFSLISFSYAKHYAMKATSDNENYVLINSRYKNAPVEAIACLIVHESFHKLDRATFEEEVAATTQEAIYWGKLGSENKDYGDDPLVARLKNLSSLLEASSGRNNLIEDKITNSSFYKSQLN